MPTAFGSRFATQRAELLKRVANIGIFQKLNDRERHELLIHGVMRNFNDKEVVFEEGSLEDRSIFFIVSGEIEIQLQGYEKNGTNTVATLTVGDLVGEMSMFNNKARSATTRSKGHSTLLQLDILGMMNHTSSNPSPDLTIKILTYIAESLSDKISNMNSVLQRWSTRVGSAPSPSRIALWMSVDSGYSSTPISSKDFSSRL
jgi:CRP-like cAMP-binding protein